MLWLLSLSVLLCSSGAQDAPQEGDMSVAPAYLCDACRAVAHQVPKAFEAELVKLGSSKLGEVGVFEAAISVNIPRI